MGEIGDQLVLALLRSLCRHLVTDDAHLQQLDFGLRRLEILGQLDGIAFHQTRSRKHICDAIHGTYRPAHEEQGDDESPQDIEHDGHKRLEHLEVVVRAQITIRDGGNPLNGKGSLLENLLLLVLRQGARIVLETQTLIR